MPSSAVYCQCHSFLCLIPMPETSLSLQTFIFKYIQAISLILSISAIIISLFWIWKPGVSWKAIIVLFLTWQFLFVVHSVFLSNLFPPKLFFLLTALLILFLVSVSFSFLRWPTKDFFLIGLTLCLFLVYKYILSFCLFIHSNYFFLGYFRNVSAGLFWFFWMLLWIFPRTFINSSYIAADWIWVLKV